MDEIKVVGARIHNLKNLNVNIHKNKITLITGVSGSEKSSLAFDTIFDEGMKGTPEEIRDNSISKTGPYLF